VKFVAGTTSLVGKFPSLLGFVWSLISSLGGGVAFDSIVCFIKLTSLSERTPSSTLSCSSCNACSLTSASLSLADRHHFELNLFDLLDKSKQCKRNWALNVLAARQRHERHKLTFIASNHSPPN